VKSFSQEHFRFGVFAFDGRHHSAAGGLVNGVCHCFKIQAASLSANILVVSNPV
jgi:hypothetical protein